MIKVFSTTVSLCQGKFHMLYFSSLPKWLNFRGTLLTVSLPAEIVFAFLPAEMTSGKVALYVLALRSSCENPDATTLGNNINLVHVLEEKTKEELNYFCKRHTGNS